MFLRACLLTAATLVAFAPPAAADTASLRTELEAASARWHSTAPSDYSFVLTVGHAFGASKYRISVTAGRCKAKLVKNTGLGNPIDCADYTVPGVFSILRTELARNPDSATATFDDKLGYVTNFRLEQNMKITDSEWGATVSDMRVRKK